jgi:hypothetical protein
MSPLPEHFRRQPVPLWQCTLGGCSVFEIASFFIVRAIYMIAEKESDLFLKAGR